MPFGPSGTPSFPRTGGCSSSRPHGLFNSKPSLRYWYFSVTYNTRSGRNVFVLANTHSKHRVCLISCKWVRGWQCCLPLETRYQRDRDSIQAHSGLVGNSDVSGDGYHFSCLLLFLLLLLHSLCGLFPFRGNSIFNDGPFPYRWPAVCHRRRQRFTRWIEAMVWITDQLHLGQLRQFGSQTHQKIHNK